MKVVGPYVFGFFALVVISETVGLLMDKIDANTYWIALGATIAAFGAMAGVVKKINGGA